MFATFNQPISSIGRLIRFRIWFLQILKILGARYGAGMMNSWWFNVHSMVIDWDDDDNMIMMNI
jgi:hypothetical protein